MRKILFFFIICFVIWLDVVSKIYIEGDLFGTAKIICQDPMNNSFASVSYCENNTIQINPYFAIQLSYNAWVAFSFPIHGIPLQILTICLIAGICFYYFRYELPKKSWFLDIGFAMILGWALSHAYERIVVGHVVDFISVKYFAIFNFADIFISIGACILFFAYYVRKQ